MDYAIRLNYFSDYWMIMEDTFQYDNISNELERDIDKVLTDINERNPVMLKEYTPSILVDNGIKDLPMYENPSHIRKNILTEKQAKKIGLRVNEKDHYHGLGKDLYLKVINNLDKPRTIFKSKIHDNEFLILTTIKDCYDNTIIVPMEAETTTKVNNQMVEINRIKTIYGYNRKKPDLNKYIRDNIKANKLEKIYKKENPSTNITSQLNSSIDNIPQVNNYVK